MFARVQSSLTLSSDLSLCTNLGLHSLLASGPDRPNSIVSPDGVADAAGVKILPPSPHFNKPGPS
jgi:hypothetical protein